MANRSRQRRGVLRKGQLPATGSSTTGSASGLAALVMAASIAMIISRKQDGGSN